ncbi:MAG: lipid II flippase MurJ, partial [Luteolibacter sp.]
LLFYAWLKVLQPAFYAIDKRWLPMLVSFLALALNLGFNYFFVFVMKWGHESLALTTSIVASVNFIILFLAMRRFAGDLGTAELLVLFGKLLFAGAVMGGVCVLADRYLFTDLGETRILIKVVYLCLTMGVASAVYFLAAKLMRVSEAQDAVRMISRKLRK